MKKIILIPAFWIFIGLVNICPDNYLLFDVYNKVYSHISIFKSLPKIYKKGNSFDVVENKNSNFNWQIENFDLKNYYIKFIFDGNIKGYVYFAVFLSADKKPVIGVSVLKLNGRSWTSFYAFYKFDGQNITEVTDKVMPRLTLKDFFPKNYDLSDVPLLIFCQLPKDGTTTLMKIQKNYYDEIEDRDSIKENEENNAMSNATHQLFSFKWNYNKGKFEPEK